MSSQHRVKTWSLTTLVLVAGLAGAQDNTSGASATSGSQAMSARYEDLNWQTMLPELAKDSPKISILRVDPKTKATQLLIRMPQKMHFPSRWHSANETHTIIQGSAVFEHEGKYVHLGSGGFN